VEVTEGYEVEPGPGEEAVDEAGPVLHLLEPSGQQAGVVRLVKALAPVLRA
jgi:hypothetical protein